MDSTLWTYRTNFKVTIGFAPFMLIYGSEAIVPMEFLVSPNLRIAIENNKLSFGDSFDYKLDKLLELE